MTNDLIEGLDLDILSPEQNCGYLPKPIPNSRDHDIVDLLSRCMASQTLPRLQRSIRDGQAMVLRVFAERMASAAIRNTSATQLRLGLVALLLTFEQAEARDGFAILPLFNDAIERLHLDPSGFTESVRQTVGDRIAMPFTEFQRRSDKSLQAMGYGEGMDGDGFRYVRNW